MNLEKAITLRISDSIGVVGCSSDDGNASYAWVDLSDIQTVNVDDMGLQFADANGHQLRLEFDPSELNDCLTMIEDAIREFVTKEEKRK